MTTIHSIPANQYEISRCSAQRQVPVAAIGVTLLLIGAVGSIASADFGYRPSVGQAYEYGIEIRALPVNPKRVIIPALIDKRVRVRYEVIESSGGRVRLSYETVPFHSSGPYQSKEEIERQIELTLRPPTSVGPEGAPRLQAMRARSAELRARSLVWKKTNYFVYTGISQFCSGSVEMSPDATTLNLLGGASLPWLLGNVAAIPFVQRASDSSEISFGYKEVIPLQFVDEIHQTKAESVVSRLHSLTKSNETGPNGQIMYDRDFELLGGGSVGRDLQASGDGYWEVARTNGMPISGMLQSRVQGMDYEDRGSTWDVRVSFMYLKPWQQMLFDQWMTPTEDALSAESLPRPDERFMMKVARQIEMDFDSAWRNHELAGIRWKDYSPPIVDGDVETKLKEIATSEEGREALSHTFSNALSTWDRQREAARVVPRVWSDSSGDFEIRATLSHRDGNTVYLQRMSDRSSVAVPLERLSEPDQDIVRRFALTASSESDSSPPE
ncbi:MAG: SHD1 domain-containing protein [Planctomycetota bacterium]